MPGRKLVNFRDVSAYINVHSPNHLKENQVFRAADLCFSRAEDLRSALNHYQIKTYIDFRQSFEQERSGISPVLKELGVEHLHLSIDTHCPSFQNVIHPDVEHWVDFYSYVYGEQLSSWKKFVRHLLQAPLNIVYGCSAGKDRTGVATAIFLTLLGVKRDLIVEDFSLTTAHLVSNAHHYSYLWKEHPSRTQALVVEHFLKAKPEKLRGFLDRYRWSKEQLRVDLALTHDDITRLQQRFL